MEEKLYQVELTQKEMEVLEIGCTQFRAELYNSISDIEAIFGVSEDGSFSHLDEQQIKNLILMKADFDALTSAFDKFDKARK